MILCANLERRKDRKYVISNSFPSIEGTSLKFFQAVDGEQIPQWKLRKFPPGTTSSRYAVRLTKRLALRKFLQTDFTHLLYLEDDIVTAEEFPELLDEALIKNHDLTFLGGGHSRPPIGSGRWKKCALTYNNHALLFSRTGAQKTLNLLRRWREPSSDEEIQRATIDHSIEAYCCDPWVVFQRETLSDNWGNTDQVTLHEDDRPFLLPDDLAVIDAALNQSKTVIEYGSGGSTLHIGRRLKKLGGHLVSIEHNQVWHDKIKPRIEALDLPVTYLLKQPIPNRSEDGPWRYLPGQLDHYVEAPLDVLSNNSVDLIFIDGRERIRCALKTLPLLRSGGLLMIHDFWDRDRYRTHLQELLKYFDYLFDTPMSSKGDPQGLVVFRKP